VRPLTAFVNIPVGQWLPTVVSSVRIGKLRAPLYRSESFAALEVQGEAGFVAIAAPPRNLSDSKQGVFKKVRADRAPEVVQI
jgi:hypothetical protein